VSRVLLAGESWTTTSIHTKGFDSFTTTTYEEGCGPFIQALESAGHAVRHMPSHQAAEHFPSAAAELEAYDVVVLSDIGANTLLLPSRTFRDGEAGPNRLKELAAWVARGGALLMVGGYLSFQGLEAKANYKRTPLAEALPVVMEDFDDREEAPEGAVPTTTVTNDLTARLPREWPALLGFQRATARPGAQVLAEVNGHPLLVVGRHGMGRVAAFMSDMGPHWLPEEFVRWSGYPLLWQGIVEFLSPESETVDPQPARAVVGA
jgi:uncharacterized membrane protein